MNIDKAVTLHFHAAVWLSIAAGILALNQPDLMVPDGEGLFGPLRNNFLIVIGYLVFSQIGLWYFRYLKGYRIDALVMGGIFLLTAAGAKFYGMVNGLPVSDGFVLALVYFGLSHVLYYGVRHRAEAEEARPGRRSSPEI